jgi:hypothetical protein
VKNILRFLKSSTPAMAVVFYFGVSTELYSMNKFEGFPVQFNYVMPTTKKINAVGASVVYNEDHGYVNGDDLYVAAQSYAPKNFIVKRITDASKDDIADNNSKVFYPDWGDGEFVFTVYGE